jgi:hypothetical protein
VFLMLRILIPSRHESKDEDDTIIEDKFSIWPTKLSGMNVRDPLIIFFYYPVPIGEFHKGR